MRASGNADERTLLCGQANKPTLLCSTTGTTLIRREMKEGEEISARGKSMKGKTRGRWTRLDKVRQGLTAETKQKRDLGTQVVKSLAREIWPKCLERRKGARAVLCQSGTTFIRLVRAY